MTDSKKFTGGCYCKKTTYTATAAPRTLDFCYCKTCQQLGGAPFITWAGVRKVAVQWHGQEPAIYRANIGDTGICISERTYCRDCGSNLTMWYEFYPETIYIAAGTVLQSDFPLRTDVSHIWVRQAPGWYSIPEDGARRNEEFTFEFQRDLDRVLKEKRDGASTISSFASDPRVA